MAHFGKVITIAATAILLLLVSSPKQAQETTGVTACWVNWDACLDEAKSLYETCKPYRKEAGCEWVFDFQRTICNGEYDDCPESAHH